MNGRARTVRLPIGSGYRYMVGSGLIPIVAVGTAIGFVVSPLAGVIVLTAGIGVLVLGLRTTGVFGVVRGAEVEVSSRIIGVSAWSRISTAGDLVVAVVPGRSSPMTRVRFGSTTPAVVLHGCDPNSGQWARQLLPEYGHALLRLTGDTDCANAVAEAISRARHG